jgi:hypothetical protein
MTGKMDWRRARLYGRPTLDKRYELDMPDRADKWIAAVERNQAQRRQRQREYRSLTAPSSHAQL